MGHFFLDLKIWQIIVLVQYFSEKTRQINSNIKLSGGGDGERGQIFAHAFAKGCQREKLARLSLS